MRKQLIFALVIMLVFCFAVAKPQSSPVEGQLIANFFYGEFPWQELNTTPLATLIFDSENLIGSVQVSTRGGLDIPRDQQWVSQEANETFREAINTAISHLAAFDARNERQRHFTGELTRGEVFHFVLRLENNPGFNAFALRLSIPQGLELTSIYYNSLNRPTPDGLPEEEAFPLIGSANAHAIVAYAGVSDFTQKDADLLVYTFKVSETAKIGVMQPLTLDFASRNAADPPRSVTSGAVTIKLPNNSGQLPPICIVDN